MNDYHFSISLGRTLFSELLGAALPLEIKRGAFDLVQNARDLARQLEVKEKVAGLLVDRDPQDALVKAKDRVAEVWRDRREDVYALLNEMVKVEGEWQLELDRRGSDLQYGVQKVGAEATVKLVAEGKATLLKENVELPFKFEKRVGAHAWLADIRFDKGQQALVADVKDVGLNLGESLVFRLVNDLVHKLLDEQVTKVNPVKILPKAQFDEMLGPVAESPLKLKMDVDEMMLEVDEQHITLKVRFGFQQLQLTAGGAAGA